MVTVDLGQAVTKSNDQLDELEIQKHQSPQVGHLEPSEGLGEIHRERRGLGADRPYPSRHPPHCNRLKSFNPF